MINLEIKIKKASKEAKGLELAIELTKEEAIQYVKASVELAKEFDKVLPRAKKAYCASVNQALKKAREKEVSTDENKDIL